MALSIAIAAIGAARSGPEAELFERYRTRFDALAPRVGLKPLAVKIGDPAKRLTGRKRRDAEASWLLAAAPQACIFVSLDEGGDPLSTQRFCDFLAQKRDDGEAGIAFLIGGAEGHGGAVAAAAQRRIAFGVATWPHLLARVMLAEQLYRAATMLAGTPYHNA
ncbi:MAG: 23S rRNA (pseudouridine(1915)-N(3))-methyltransferase RlmH [Pseudomonadota bacterium]